MAPRSFMKLKMIRTSYGSPDGVQVEEYKKGETYDMRETLAVIFLKEGWAVKVEKSPRKTKDHGTAPENKTVKAKAPARNKSGRIGGSHGA